MGTTTLPSTFVIDKDSRIRTILRQQTTIHMVQCGIRYHHFYRTTSSTCQYNQQIPHHVTKIHDAQLFVVNFWNFSIPSSRPHLLFNYLSMTQRMNEFRQKFEKLYHFQIWLSEQNIATYHTSLYQLIKIYQNILLSLHVIIQN